MNSHPSMAFNVEMRTVEEQFGIVRYSISRQSTSARNILSPDMLGEFRSTILKATLTCAQFVGQLLSTSAGCHGYGNNNAHRRTQIDRKLGSEYYHWKLSR